MPSKVKSVVLFVVVVSLFVFVFFFFSTSTLWVVSASFSFLMIKFAFCSHLSLDCAELILQWQLTIIPQLLEKAE